MVETVLDRLKAEVLASGSLENTEEFKKKLLALRVDHCKQMNGVPVCSECRAFEFCNLVEEYKLSR